MYSINDGGELKIIFQNTRSLHKHHKDLRYDTNLHTADIIATVETRFKKDEIDNLYTLPGYNIYRNDQDQENKTRPFHGTATYFSHQIIVHKCLHYSDTAFESSYFELEHQNKPNKFHLVVLYRSPSGLRSEFHHRFENMCSELHIGEKDRVVLIGDFNIDVLDSANVPEIKKMEQISQCTQQVKEFTTDNHTCLDLLFTNYPFVKTWLLSCTWSDHHTLFATITI